MGMLSLKFEDFKRLASNHRVYYFEGKDFVDLHYLVDGHIIKTAIIKKDITNPKAFFSDKLFYGATQLAFRIPDESDNNVSVKTVPEEKGIDIQTFQNEEVKKTDIQRKGVKADGDDSGQA